MFETIVITTAELVGVASGTNWSADWSFAFNQNKLVGSVKVESSVDAAVQFSLETPAPWVHNQWVYGGFDFHLKLPQDGGAVTSVGSTPVWVLNGNNWLVPPLNMGSSGAGYLNFSWYPPATKYVPSGTLSVEANWHQTANMSVKFVSDTSTKTWDLNSDGVVGMGDLLVLLWHWNNPWTTADLIALLSAWSQ